MCCNKLWIRDGIGMINKERSDSVHSWVRVKTPPGRGLPLRSVAHRHELTKHREKGDWGHLGNIENRSNPGFSSSFFLLDQSLQNTILSLISIYFNCPFILKHKC